MLETVMGEVGQETTQCLHRALAPLLSGMHEHLIFISESSIPKLKPGLEIS